MDEARKSNRLSDLFRRSPRAADIPDIPKPPTDETYDVPAPDMEQVEEHHREDSIDEMDVHIHHQEGAFIVDGKLVTYEWSRKRVAGCGHIVSRIGEEKGSENAIVGICPFCQEEGHRPSYCRICQRICEKCHINTCYRHHLESENLDGTTSMVCPECLDAAARRRLVHQTLAPIASLFIRKTPQLPSGRSEDDC